MPSPRTVVTLGLLFGSCCISTYPVYSEGGSARGKDNQPGVCAWAPLHWCWALGAGSDHVVLTWCFLGAWLLQACSAAQLPPVPLRAARPSGRGRVSPVLLGAVYVPER